MKNSTLLKPLFLIVFFYVVSFTSAQAAPKLYFYPDSTQEVNTTLGIAPGYFQSLLMNYTYLPGKNITVILVRERRPVTTNKILTPNKSGRTVINISDMMSQAKEGDRLVIMYSVYTITIPITEKAKDVTPEEKRALKITNTKKAGFIFKSKQTDTLVFTPDWSMITNKNITISLIRGNSKIKTQTILLTDGPITTFSVQEIMQEALKGDKVILEYQPNSGGVVVQMYVVVE